MTDHPAPNATRPRPPHQPRQSGGAGKWLIGAVVAILLIGGGYYAWKNNGASSSSETAVNSEYPEPAVNDATAPAANDNGGAYNGAGSSDAVNEKSAAATAPTNGQSADKSANAQSAAAAKPKKAPAAAVAAAAIPEETIGVSRATESTGKKDEIVVTARRPIWKSVPRGDRLAAFYPDDALERGREGEASLRCMIGEGGKLACETVSETPARAGFGAAALRISRALRHAEKKADGSNAIGTPINLRILFRMPKDERRG